MNNPLMIQVTHLGMLQPAIVNGVALHFLEHGKLPLPILITFPWTVG